MLQLRFKLKPIFLLSLVLLVIQACSNKEQAARVELQGKLVNWGNASKILNSNSLESDFGLGNDQLISTDIEGNFVISFELDEPTYFSLGRNKLYLSPGEELYLEIDYKDPETAVFKGQSAEIQSYLAGVAFPKSGSYLEGGRGLKSSDINDVVNLAQAKTSERTLKLEELNSASDEFLMLENMRLKLDQLNTILSMPVYGSFKNYWEYSEEKKAEVLSNAKDELNALSAGLMHDEFMVHPNFRDMLLDLVNSQLQRIGIFSNLTLTPFMAEYDEMGAFVTQLKLNGLNDDMQAKANKFMNSQHSEIYKEMVDKKLKEYESLLPGQPAFDLVLRDALGSEIPLSEFTGQLIYVDLWATWCGPCIEELPAFEKLKDDYEDQPISFIPVSIDTDLDAWQRYLEKNDLPKDHEYVINRLDLSDYKVITIPRYLLLDKHFKIISVFAPVPSSPKTRDLLDKYLSETE